MNPTGPIVFYDGECGLCARSVQWALARDRRDVLRFAPLQGRTYAELVLHGKPAALDTMVLLDDDGLHVRSTGALRLLRHLGGVWGVIGAMLMVVPRPVRDWAYGVVARHRLGWFGDASSCRLPTGERSQRFLP
ncbi:MAG: thiol-disulfide oxidoreductase DCC family protein [Phycisphaerales bacterium]